MSIYARITCVIIATAMVIIASGLMVGTYFLTQHMSDAIEESMVIVVDMAEKYVADEIKLLKIQAAEAAQKINLSYQAGEREGVLERVCADHPLFVGLAVFDETTLLDSWGPSVPPDLSSRPFMSVAQDGGQAVSTTMYSQDGVLVMYVSAPMNDGLVLAAVLPALYFSDLLSRFTIYQTGHLFIDDADGYVIVNSRPEWVQKRVNFIEMAQSDDTYKDLEAIVRRGLAGEQGTARFTMNGVPRIWAFRPVSSPNEDWFIGLSVPLTESPLKEIPGGMFRTGMITLALSIVAALLAAGLLKRPYEVKERLREVAVMDSKAKSHFLAHISHEIRTPLNAVIGLSELTLDEEYLSRGAESNLEKIYNAGSTILSIINDILDISKIESGKFELWPVQYDIPSLINDTVVLNVVRIGEKDIVFTLHVDENLPSVLYGDDLRVKQIFNNLLSNAFKYTHSGVVEWRVSFERDGDDVWLVSSVRDTGIGVRPEDVQHLFLDYYQVNLPNNQRIDGTGLGLAITQRLVDMMAGNISVESEYGKGSTFHVRLRQSLVSDLPIGKEVAENLMGLRYTLSKRASNRKHVRIGLSYAHVLVVDDVETNLDVVKGMLRPYRVKVDCAASGHEAVKMIRSEVPRYDAIFMDHMMPGMDGIEATRIIREEIGTDYARNIPIIALTANAIVGNEEVFLSQGFQAFISKPIDMQRLDSVLRRWVRDKKRERELSMTDENNEDWPDPASFPLEDGHSLLKNITIQGLDQQRCLERLGGNETVFIDVLRSYAVNTPSLLSKLRTFLEAENLVDYAITVHGLKGSSYGICAQEAGQAAESLEREAKAENLDAVKAGHDVFEAAAGSLLVEIKRTLDAIDGAIDKPVAARPDPSLLEELRKACEAFDMDRVDETIGRLESFRYEQGGQLVAWLREHISDMTFEQISNGEWPAE